MGIDEVGIAHTQGRGVYSQNREVLHATSNVFG